MRDCDVAFFVFRSASSQRSRDVFSEHSACLLQHLVDLWLLVRVRLQEMVQLCDTLLVHSTGGLTCNVVHDDSQLLIKVRLLRRSRRAVSVTSRRRNAVTPAVA